jgi:spore coat protein CotF
MNAYQLLKKALNQCATKFTHSSTVKMSVKARFSLSNSCPKYGESSGSLVSKILTAKFCHQTPNNHAPKLILASAHDLTIVMRKAKNI